jgi:NH3-dependent NAD+ synthetase
MPVLKPAELINERVDAIRRLHAHTGLKRAQLDLSGGIDSATMAGLLLLALGPDQITMVYSCINSSAETQRRAADLAEGLGIALVVHNLTPTYEAMVQAMVDNLVALGWQRAGLQSRMDGDPTVLGSIRACLRAPLGRGYSRLTGNGLRHGTGNECEDRWLRFYQKGGDAEVDTNPMAMLSKGEVFQLARALGERLDCAEAYGSIIQAPPSPELWGQGMVHTDEDEIGSHLGITDSGQRFYSYIDAPSGAYASVGMIERVTRFVDTAAGAALFDDDTSDADLEQAIAAAADAPAMVGLEPALVSQLLTAARRAERVSRHKANPAIPFLGTRAALLNAGILTDNLPHIAG